MKVKFNSWKNTPEELRYRGMCLKFSEVAELAAPNNDECDDVNNWIENKLKRLQLSQTKMKSKEVSKACELVEEEKKDEMDDCREILDPLSQTRKGRPRKNRITKRRSKQKSDHQGNVAVNNACLNQVPAETSTPVSLVSNAYMPQSWGVYQPAQPFTYEHSFCKPQLQMSGNLHSMGVPMYGFQYYPPQKRDL